MQDTDGQYPFHYVSPVVEVEEVPDELTTAYAVRYTMRSKRTGEFVTGLYRTFFLTTQEAREFIEGSQDSGHTPRQGFADIGYTDITFTVLTMIECPF